MNPEPEQFEKVRRLLAFKRYEQPPPGYFVDFSARVITRIQALEVNPAWPWWQRLLFYLEERPLLAGASGVACCGILLCGLSLSQLVADTSMPVASLIDPIETASIAASTGLMLLPGLGTPQAQPTFSPSTNPAIPDEPPDLDLNKLRLKSMIPVSFQYQ